MDIILLFSEMYIHLLIIHRTIIRTGSREQTDRQTVTDQFSIDQFLSGFWFPFHIHHDGDDDDNSGKQNNGYKARTKEQEKEKQQENEKSPLPSCTTSKVFESAPKKTFSW